MIEVKYKIKKDELNIVRVLLIGKSYLVIGDILTIGVKKKNAHGAKGEHLTCQAPSPFLHLFFSLCLSFFPSPTLTHKRGR